MIRTFIYGSCVSRDTFEFLPRGEFELIGYVARQSVISAFSHLELHDMPVIDVSSPFQRRMLEGDWTGSLVARVSTLVDQIDLFLWDLCDERLGIYELDKSMFITKSVDALASGLDDQLPVGTQHFPLGSNRHLELFAENASRLHSLLATSGLLERTLLLGPRWAHTMDDGLPAPTSYGRSADEANPIFDTYHQHLIQQHGLLHLSTPTDITFADSQHKWGAAPFHYAAPVYKDLSSQIVERTSRNP